MGENMARYVIYKSELRRTLAKNVRLLRQWYQVSQCGLAQQSGLHRTYISAVERGRVNISLDNLGKIAGALGVVAHELIMPSKQLLEIIAVRPDISAMRQNA